MVIGFSGPVDFISSMSAFPMEVTRSETCRGSPSSVPCHEPARVCNLSNDFCASDWSKARVESDSRTTDSTKRRDFMVALSRESLEWQLRPSFLAHNRQVFSSFLFRRLCFVPRGQQPASAF